MSCATSAIRASPSEPERPREAGDLARDDVAHVALLGPDVGLVGVGEAAQVGHDHVVVRGERRDHRRPLVPEARPAVQQQHG